MAFSGARRTRGGARSSGRSPTEWGVVAKDATTVPVGTTNFVIVPNSQVADMTEPTLARIHGALTFSSTASANSGVVAVGLIVLNKSFPTTGLDPVLDGDADWLMWRAYPINRALNGVSTQIVGTGAFSEEGVFGYCGSRAMRKLDEDEEVRLMVNNDISNGESINVTFAFRYLLMQVGTRRR